MDKLVKVVGKVNVPEAKPMPKIKIEKVDSPEKKSSGSEADVKFLMYYGTYLMWSEQTLIHDTSVVITGALSSVSVCS